MPRQRMTSTPDQAYIKSHMNITHASCWEWCGTRDKDGYAVIRRRREDGSRKWVRMNRASWIAFHGEIPGTLLVLHKCDNAQCVNPDHLFLGSCAENMADMRQKKRHFHKITSNGITDMRLLFGYGSRIADIAKLFKISLSRAYQIIKPTKEFHYV